MRAYSLLAATLLWSAAAHAYDWNLPRGFPEPAVPADNPMSDEKVALGRRLFCETRLSITGQHSCASCHQPELAFTDGRKVGVGATGARLPHNSMALVNVAYNITYGWQKPHLQSLEAQMLEPLLNEHPVELGLKGREAEVAWQLAEDPEYRDAFVAAFGDEDPVTFENIVRAIAAFERTLISGRSPFDRYVFGGEHDVLDEPAKRGMALFFSERTGCAGCHSGINFSGPWRDAQGTTGKAPFAQNGTSSEKLRVPTLRNVTLTAPYMHDGRFATLQEVLDHYEQAGALSADAGGRSGAPGLKPLRLTPQERVDLVAFLESLTDQEFLTRARETLGPYCTQPSQRKQH